MGLISVIVENGKKMKADLFDFYLFSGEEGIVYCYFKKDIETDISFGGKISSELIRLFEINKEFTSSAQRFIFDFSTLGESVPIDFFNSFKSNLILFVESLSRKRVDVIVSRGVVRGNLNKVFQEDYPHKKFFAIPPFDGDIEELMELERQAVAGTIDKDLGTSLYY